MFIQQKNLINNIKNLIASVNQLQNWDSTPIGNKINEIYTNISGIEDYESPTFIAASGILASRNPNRM